MYLRWLTLVLSILIATSAIILLWRMRGGALGTDDDTFMGPNFLLESDIVSRAAQENFETDKWLCREHTVWEQPDGVYMVYKANSRINMPASDGRSGPPHPCMISGERWTYAWPSIAPKSGDATTDMRYSENQIIICDSFHQYHACKSENIKIAMGLLRRPWIGFQIYLKGGVRLIQEVPDPSGS